MKRKTKKNEIVVLGIQKEVSLLRFVSEVLPMFASKFLDWHAESRTPYEFCQWYARIPYHRDSIAKHCQIETLDLLSLPLQITRPLNVLIP